ncbi:MAG TPA: glycosyltransferase family 2 protein [Candidatus Saccharimonadales bacterium]|nr:glycosyltransferase family 2 protein [Candidatus Saccharimonadales bacterium]
MTNKKLTLSIVIPVFNEQDYLEDCLDSIAAQIDMPDEVLVIDNNCTDRSMEIARRYPFVTIIRERRQHQSYAQQTGFNRAKSEILGRIDADTVLPENWVASVKQHFLADPQLKAVTGTPWPYDVFSKHVSAAVFMFYHQLAGQLAGVQMIWGANAALRRSAWSEIKDRVQLGANIWEDYDLSLLINDKRAVKLAKDLEVGSSFRTIHEPLADQIEWQFRMVRTFYRRRSLGLTILVGLCWGTMMIFYPLTILDERVLKPLFSFEEQRREVLDSTPLVD